MPGCHPIRIKDTRFHFILLAFLMACTSPDLETGPDEDQFAMHIRTAEAKTPIEQQKAFKLPPGFKIELFASEPDIGKPMNLSFDARGRLWVTQSQAYPFADSSGAASDRITILEDTDHDGKADKFTTFADSLNIPIGIVPVSDGAIAFSIPYVYHLVDSDGDDRVDQRKILLRGFEYKDTHGMVNNFFRGLDGWIHADHGFSNVSEVVGTDNKPPLKMESGNTFRFRPDGTGVEFTTTGRVNPFGYAMDEYGYMYSVDCHSSPLYQLIRGADYPHFGKKPTGIGFGPAMMPHNYGSTALAGLDYYTGEQYPESHRQSFYLGDVVKSRVYQATIDMNGTTPTPSWQEDFVVSQDPWFRPVDVKLGPDGALYIADFYNRIIGHYEVALDHPGRDRERGRIWRITYEDNAALHRAIDWSSADLSELIAGLDHSSITVRRMVADQLVDRYGQDAILPIREMLNGPDVTTEQFIHGLWILFRLEQIDDETIAGAMNHDQELIRIHLLRILFEMDQLDPQLLEQVRKLATDQNPHISRAAVMVLAEHPSYDQVKLLLQQGNVVPEEDTHFSYSIKQGVRDHLRDQQILLKVAQAKWEKSELQLLAASMVGVDDPLAAQFLADNLELIQSETEQMIQYVNHIARWLPESAFKLFVQDLRQWTEGDPELQYQVVQSLQNGLAQRGSTNEYVKDWAVQLATIFLETPTVSGDPAGALDEAAMQQLFACEAAGTYRVSSLQKDLLAVLVANSPNHQVRLGAANALLAISKDNFSQVVTVAVDEENDALKDQLHLVLVEQKTDEAYELATTSINELSFNTQKKMVAAMSTDQRGIDQVLQAANSMEISPKILLEPSIQSTLKANMSNHQQELYEEITNNLTPFSTEIQALIQERVSGYEQVDALVQEGAAVFGQHCAACHQVGGEGGNIGPQLDGIGNRGILALSEKILDPNRSISKSFVNYSVALKDGNVKQGLYRRDEGSIRVFADLAGNEFSIPVDEIDQQTALPFTLMPDNFSSVIPEEDYFHLMSYLLEQN